MKPIPDDACVERVTRKAQRWNAKPCRACGRPASVLAEVVRLGAAPWLAAREVETSRLLTYDNGTVLARCSGCARVRVLHPVRGTMRDDIPCNAKCVGAFGPSCDCSCGGRNHGGAHSIGCDAQGASA